MRKANQRSLRVQALESRNPLAGNIIGNLVGTTLALGGDAADNQLVVTEVAPNQIQVTGLTGTTINGAPSQLFASNLIESVIIRTAEGEDQVKVENLSLTDTSNGYLGIFTSRGNDTVKLLNVTTTQQIRVDAGSEDDRITARQTSTNGLFLVNGESGDDHVRLSWVKAKDLKVETHQGVDRVSMYRAKALNDIAVNTGEDTDYIRLSRLKAGNDIEIRSEDGDDVLSTNGMKAAQDVIVKTSSGDDLAWMYRTTAGRNVVVAMDDGNDRLTMRDTNAVDNLFMELGIGDDKARIKNANVGDFYASAADGEDKMELDNINAVNDLHVKMGMGDDVLKISNSAALNPIFDGGPGFDTLYDLPNAFDEVSDSVNFEVFL
ncbi:MAG: hypothetical protein CMM07_01135 [Rhodopirellula sp.]|nr:hypothetical protein [Rhodopirellula sp.]